MNVHPLRWLGPARKAGLEQAFQSRLAAWNAQWVREDLRSELALAEFSDGDFDESTWSSAASPTGTLVIGCAPNALPRLGARLVGLGGDGGSALAPRIAYRALEALAQCLTGHATTPLIACDSPGPSLLAPRTGSLRLWLSIEDLRVALIADCALCDSALPMARRDVALVRREDALGMSTASLELRLELGHADLIDISTLRPGEVLKTTIPVGSLLSLVNPDGSVVRTGHLAARQGRRAIRIQ